MPRPRLVRSGLFPYHVTARVNNRDWFYIPPEELWAIFLREFAKVVEDLGVRITSFVLMSNHYHLLIWTPHQNLDVAMHRIQGNVSRIVGRKSGRENHVYGSRYRATLIEDDRQFSNVYRYIYQNPVRASIVQRVEDYQFSTIHSLLDKARVPFELADPHPRCFSAIPSKLDARLRWLNEPFLPAQASLIKRALKKSKFKLTTDHNERYWVRTLS